MHQPEQANMTISGTAFGVGLQAEVDSPDTEALVRECLPPDWTTGDAGEAPLMLSVQTVREGRFEVKRQGATAALGDAETVLADLDHLIRAHVAGNAPRHIFIHAGVVAHQGLAIVIPGQSFSGKTTLVAELVRSGAVYYSDEYAVIDESGLTHPYPKPLSIRLREVTGEDGYSRTQLPAGELGGSTGQEPAAIGLVVAAQYRVGASWEPVRLSPSETVLELMANTFSALDRPDQTLRTLGQAVAHATGLKGARGDAAEIAAELLALAGAATDAPRPS